MRPERGPLNVLTEWYSRKTPLLGHETNILANKEDLISVKNNQETDRISRLLRNNTGFLLGHFHKVSFPISLNLQLTSEKKTAHYPPSWGEVYTFREKHVERLVALVSVILAAGLLVGAMVSLHFTDGESLRLSLVGVFTVIFAGAVGLLTNAKRSEMFAATAA